MRKIKMGRLLLIAAMVLFSEVALSEIPNEVPLETNVYDAQEQAGKTYPGASRLSYRRGHDCTTGFAVDIKGKGRHFVTAAHCKNRLRYTDKKTRKGIGTVFIREYLDSHQDYQYFRLKSGTPTNKVYTWSKHLELRTRTITSWARKRDQKKGMLMCKTGIITGFACEYVDKTNHRPMGKDNCGKQRCANTYIKMSYGKRSVCKNGDSGGPVFRGHKAYGLIKTAGIERGKCKYTSYMPIHYVLNDRGVTLLTRP